MFARWRSLLLTLAFLQLAVAWSPTVAQEQLQFPAYGAYNFFNNHLVYIECTNLSGSHLAQIAVSLLKDNGTVIDTKNFAVDPLGTTHIDARSYRGSGGESLDNTYGLVRIEDRDNSSETQLSCSSAFYKPRSGSAVPEYAFVIPFEASQQGTVWGMFNSIDPGISPRPVENYVTVSNPTTHRLQGTFQVYNQAGQPSSSRRIELASGERVDIPVGHPNDQQITGLYSIAMDDPNHRFISFAARYHARGGGSHNFGFSLANHQGSCNERLLASTMAGKDRPAINWLELGNRNDTAVPVTIDVYGQLGEALYHEVRSLDPRSQSNLFLNDIIDPDNVGTVGSVSISCNPATPILAQTTFYGRAIGDTRVIWGYVSQARGRSGANEGATLIGAINTALGDRGTANWLKLSTSRTQAVNVEIEIFGLDGEPLSREVKQRLVARHHRGGCRGSWRISLIAFRIARQRRRETRKR